MAFTRANVGYVHAIAHQFGGRYHTPHGLANAIVLPHVLRFSAPAVTGRLARLAVRARLGDDSEREEAAGAEVHRRRGGAGARHRHPDHLAALKEADIPAWRAPPATRRTPATRCRAT
jgi:alcohol dehydrogenase